MPPIVAWVGLILILSTTKLYGASTTNLKAFPSNLSDKNSSFAVLTFIAEHATPQQFPLNGETIKNCPKLWTQTEKEFQDKEETGILGSFLKLQELCSEKQENLTPVCKGAVWISTYVCTASQGGKDLPKVKDSKNLTNVNGLCNALVGNSNLTYKLCDIVETSLKSKFALMPQLKEKPELKERLEQNCSFSSNGIQEICVEYCHDENLPLCKIILQSLRTIVSWEEEKEKAQQSDIVNNSETVDSPSSETTKAASSSSSTTEPLPPPPMQVQNGEKITATLDDSKSPVIPKTTQPSIILSSVTNKIANTTVPASSKDIVVPAKMESKTPSPTARVTTVLDTTTVLEQGTDYDDMEAGERPPVKSPGEEEPQLDDGTIDQQNNVLEDNDDADKDMEKQGDVIPEETRKPAQSNDPSEFDSDPINTHFLFYFIVFVVLSVSGYLIYMRRKYLVALMVEGRSSGSSRRRSNSLREQRPSSGSYRKLVNNLEEAITSNSVKNSNVIY